MKNLKKQEMALSIKSINIWIAKAETNPVNHGENAQKAESKAG